MLFVFMWNGNILISLEKRYREETHSDSKFHDDILIWRWKQKWQTQKCFRSVLFFVCFCFRNKFYLHRPRSVQRWELLFVQSYLLVRQSTLSNILYFRFTSTFIFFYLLSIPSFSILFTYFSGYFIRIRHPTSIFIIFCCSMRFNFRS